MERPYMASEDRFLEVHRKFRSILPICRSPHGGRRLSKSSMLILEAKVLNFVCSKASRALISRKLNLSLVNSISCIFQTGFIPWIVY